MSRIYERKHRIICFLLSLLVLNASVVFAQENAIDAGEAGENDVAAEQGGGDEYVMFDNGVIEDLGEFDITISGRKFLFQGETQGFSWDGEEKAIETFAVGYYVTFGYVPETLLLTELRMEEEFPEEGGNTPQQKTQETHKDLKFENGVYTN